MRLFSSILIGMLLLSTIFSCAEGSFLASGSFSYEVSYEISFQEIPLAEMPPKYQEWVDETKEYLDYVNWCISEINEIRNGIAAIFNISAQASGSQIARAIRNSISSTCTVQLVVEAQVSLEANASVSTNEARAQASSSGFVSVRWETVCEENMDPNVERKLNELKPLIRRMYGVPYVISTMKDRGDALASRGMELKMEVTTDLADDPTLIRHVPTMQQKLEEGSSTCREAQSKVRSIDNDTRSIINALKDTFPQ